MFDSLDGATAAAVVVLILKPAILLKLWRRGLATGYPFFTGFLAVSLVGALAEWAVYLSAGEASLAYARTYLATALLVQTAEILAVFELLRRTGELRQASLTAVVAGGLIGLVTVAYVVHRGPFVFPLTAGAGAQLGLWIVLFDRVANRRYQITRRVGGLLVGFLLMFGLQWITLVEYANEGLSYSAFRVLRPAITAVAHIIFLIAL